MVVVTRAGRLREWSQGELRLYVTLIYLGVKEGYKASSNVTQWNPVKNDAKGTSKNVSIIRVCWPKTRAGYGDEIGHRRSCVVWHYHCI